ncbi:MAG: ABC transporter permease [Vicinamibacterales bacterium]
MTTLVQDLRHGGRLLLRSPGFTTIAVAALAIGIGANTAVFSVVHTLLIQPLPYRDADRLAVIWEHNLPRDKKNNVVSPGNFIHWREMQRSFEDIAAVSGTVGLNFTVTVTGAGDPEEVPVQLVTAAFFSLLGVNPALGRPFTTEEDRPDNRVVVISDRLWRRKFAGDPGLVQKTITIDGTPRELVGVMPPGFSYLDKTVEVWLPMGFSAQSRTPRGRWINVAGRLKPGVTFEQAQQDMARAHAELGRLFPDFNTGWTARVVPLREELTGKVRPALLILLAAVAFVLLIACANVANLLLARATSRQRELAVRAALGAGRMRIVRQLLAESLVLAIAGGTTGLLLAWWGLAVLRAVVAQKLPIQRLEAVAIDGWVLLFTLVISLGTGLVFGLVPALSVSGSTLNDALKDGGRSGSAARGNKTRAAFVITEVALAVILLAGAGLLIRSFVNLLNTSPGFSVERTLKLDLSLPSSRYRDEARRIEFFQRFIDQIAALPGVQAAGAVSFLPLAGLGAATSYEVVGQPPPAKGEEPVCDVRVATNGYFKALGIPLVRGRWFNEDAANDIKNAVIINEAMARRHWPTEDPIGKRIKVSWNDTREDEIIGVVGDVRHAALETEARATNYWPYRRFPYNTMTVTVKASGDATSHANSIVSIVRNQDPMLAVADIRTMEQVIGDSVAERRLTMLLLAIFAAAALVLAAVGIYGVIAYSVTQRTQEIGIRMALGARQRDVLWMVVGHAMMLTALGIGIGAAGGLLLTRLMRQLLFQVRPADPMTFVAVAAVLSAVALTASYVPGRRAARVDPLIALRAE